MHSNRVPMSVSRPIVLAGMLISVAVCPMLHAATPPSAKHAAAPAAKHCNVQPATYEGWKAEQVSNQFVKLMIVPRLAGRLMQVTFGGHDFLFVNQNLKGQVIPIDPEHPRWNNYGGDKIWPMPEGNEDEQHWAGASNEPLDSSPFALQVISRGSRCAVRLTGPVDPAIGQQYIREISIGTDSPEISFHAVMKNVSGYPQTWSEQSVSQYNATDPNDPSHFNTHFWGMTPANPSSVFPGGYHVRTGQPTNPLYSVSDGMFHLNWGAPGAQGGEVWTDSPGGWLAVVDGTTGYTMVERHDFDPRADYPGQTTMIFFTTGQGRPRPASATAAAPALPAQGQNAPPRIPIFYMEAEVNSPMVKLKPGESFAMDTTWYPTRMGDNFKTTTYSGVVGKPLTASATPAGLVLTGEFGVFYQGTLLARFYRGGELAGIEKLAAVTPLQPIDLQQTVQAPQGTSRVSIHLIDESGADRGPLSEVLVNPPPAGGRRRPQ